MEFECGFVELLGNVDVEVELQGMDRSKRRKSHEQVVGGEVVATPRQEQDKQEQHRLKYFHSLACIN